MELFREEEVVIKNKKYVCLLQKEGESHMINVAPSPYPYQEGNGQVFVVVCWTCGKAEVVKPKPVDVG